VFDLQGLDQVLDKEEGMINDYIWHLDFSIPPQLTDISNPEDTRPMVQYWTQVNKDSPPVPVYSIEHPGPSIKKHQETFFNGPFGIAVSDYLFGKAFRSIQYSELICCFGFDQDQVQNISSFP
jgi:hypothetical protein